MQPRTTLRTPLLAATLLAGCQAYDHARYMHLVEAGARDAADVPPVPRTLVYVVDSITIDGSSAPDVPHTGFDLDGLCSDGSGARDCSHTDYFSAIDPDQNTLSSCGAGCHHGCVDNQLPAVADTLVGEGFGDPRASVSESVTENQTIYLIVVEGVDSLADDDSVTVSFARGLPTFGVDCDRVIPGRTYRIARTSLATGGTSIQDALYRTPASIVGGRLHVATSPGTHLPLDLQTRRGTVPFDLDLTRIRATLTATTGTDGNLGGRIDGADFAAALCAMAPAFCPLIDDAVGRAVDIQQMGVCYDSTMSPPAFGDIGLAIGFTMVQAQIDPAMPVADARDPGTCGAPAPQDAGASDGGADDAGADDASVPDAG